ncbi:hypothetical protein B484DRAFT_47575 [Ochromonadaceae sp. CCMP2298]|nr:hypothetical protein B484DRAFT_47575 [Ochromonadaceae sp. CCMP2298]
MHRTKPGYGASMAASRLLKQGRQGLMQASLGVTGLTGPGEPWFNISSRAVPPKVEGEEEKEEVESEDEDEARYFPSVFSELREAEEKELRALEGEEEADSDDDNDDDDSAYRERKNKFGWDGNTYPDPAQLDLNASAAQVVQAWAFRLKDVYDKCMPQDASEFEDVDDFMIPRNSPHVRLTTAYRPHGHHGQAIARKRSDLLGEPEEEAPRPPDDPTFVLVPASPVRRPPPATPANTGAPGYVGKPWSNSAKGFPGAGGVVISPRTVDWREELKRFYMSVGLPEKILGIPTILKTWANKEEQMLSALMERYEESIPPQMMHHLETLLAQLDAHTESSFVREKAKKGVVKVGTGEEGKASGRIAREREKEAKKGSRAHAHLHAQAHVQGRTDEL